MQKRERSDRMVATTSMMHLRNGERDIQWPPLTVLQSAAPDQRNRGYCRALDTNQSQFL
jgi:hypothetical protein